MPLASWYLDHVETTRVDYASEWASSGKEQNCERDKWMEGISTGGVLQLRLGPITDYDTTTGNCERE